MQLAKNTGKPNFNPSIKPILLIVIALIIFLASVITTFAINSSKLGYDRIYKGVFVLDADVGRMTIEEAAQAIDSLYSIDRNRTITLLSGPYSVKFDLSELSATIDSAKCAEKAFELGRKGSRSERLERIKEIEKNNEIIDIIINMNEEILSAKINEIANKVDIPERELGVELLGDELVLTRGRSGYRIIEENARKAIISAILDKNSSAVELKTEEIRPVEPSVEYLISEVCGEPEDASYLIQNQRLKIIDEKIGVTLVNEEEAAKLLKHSQTDVIRIPVKTESPTVTAEKIKSELFVDLLSSYSSNYDASNTSRAHNLALASKLISDVVLAPGDVFSYNESVGPRTSERGFKSAGVYVGNKVEQGIGGGICQVSSTLFNTVVLADLKIVYRTNHSLPVSYVPLGRDATVSYGSIDFKFSNNTSAPIKISARASGGRNTIEIYGNKENKTRTIEIMTEKTATYPAKTIRKEDPSLKEGTVKVEERGNDGSTYVTYKVTKENGEVVKTEEITRSTYQATDRIEITGIKRKGTLSEETESTSVPAQVALAETPAPPPGQTAVPDEPNHMAPPNNIAA